MFFLHLIKIVVNILMKFSVSVHTNLNPDTDIAWYDGDMALKSEFYTKLLFEAENIPFAFDYKWIFAAQTAISFWMKSFL
jgi:hypothetical protein